MAAGVFLVNRSGRLLLAGSFQVPEDRGYILAQPDAEAQVAEISLQAPPVPVAGAKVHRAIGSRLVAILTPVFARQRRDVQRGPPQPREACERPRRLTIIHVLHHLV